MAASNGDITVGHGSGKTLFCRLLRYCLGEDRFAPGEQCDRIANAFPDRRVGADVMLDGIRWFVVRPIGAGRRHLAIRNADLDQVANGDGAATGIAPFLEAVVASLLSNEVAALIPGDDSTNAWLVALAWLSRDQECRFDKLLDWRSPDSDSGSPARNLAVQQRRDALRTLIGAVVSEEFELRTEHDDLEACQKTVSQEVIRLECGANSLRSGLVREFGLDLEDLLPGRIAVQPLRAEANADMARLAKIDPSADAGNISALRSESNSARQRVEALQSRQSALQERIPVLKKLVSRINGEMPAASARAGSFSDPVCPICEVPINQVLAEGCKLSHKLPNLNDARQRLDALEREHAEESRRLAESR